MKNINPLDKFRSYSVHHILLAGRSTEEAKDFCDEEQNVKTLEAISRVQKLGESVVYNNKADKIFLVLDTRRFSQFTIENLRYEVLLNGLTANQSHANFATDLSMTILDSVGISFVNFMQWLFDTKLQTNSDGTIFILKTIFVGHTETGKSEIVHAETIPMHLMTMALNLDYAKGAYSLTFFPNTNFNITKQKRLFHIGQASTYFTGRGANTLGQMVSNFEQALNKKSSEYFNKVQQHIEKVSGKNVNFGRQVKYMITLPEKWKNFDFTGSSEGASTETVFKSLKAVESNQEKNEKQKEADAAKKKQQGEERQVTDSHLSVESGILITEVLDIMFGQVHEIKKMGNNQQSSEKDGFVTFYKYITSVTSDDTTMTVHVDVVEFVVPNRLVVEKNKNSVSQNENNFYTIQDGKKVPKNFIEFDYIFTGLNKDVLSLDLKIENLEMLLLSNINVSAGKYFLVNDSGTPPNEVPRAAVPEVGIKYQYDPILMPQNTKSVDENFSQYSIPEKSEKMAEFITTSQEYSRNLSMFYAASPIQTNMVIKGNPLLFRKFNVGTVPSNVQSTTNISPEKGNSIPNAQTHAGYREDLERRVLKTLPAGSAVNKGSVTVDSTLDSQTYATAPVFVKLNIKGPTVDFTTNEMVKGKDFSSSILPDVYFAVFKVVHNFEGSNFTQELELFSHNIYSGDASKPALNDSKEKR